MTAAYFVDTNVLLYSVSTMPDEAEKRGVARQILTRSDIGFSVQVLQEFYVQAIRHAPEPVPHEVAVNCIRSWLRFPVQEQTTHILTAALETKARYQISYWDAAIVEAARILKCHTLWSEDLSDGQNYGGVRVVNPFKGAS